MNDTKTETTPIKNNNSAPKRYIRALTINKKTPPRTRELHFNSLRSPCKKKAIKNSTIQIIRSGIKIISPLRTNPKITTLKLNAIAV